MKEQTETGKTKAMRNDDNKGGDADSVRPAALQFDAEKYRSEVEQFDITEVQKQELLTTLWSIMSSFVDLGFSVDVCAALLDPVPFPDNGEVS